MVVIVPLLKSRMASDSAPTLIWVPVGKISPSITFPSELYLPSEYEPPEPLDRSSIETSPFTDTTMVAPLKYSLLSFKSAKYS